MKRNNAAMNIIEDVSLWYDWVAFGFMPKSDIAVPWGILIHNFLRRIIFFSFLKDCFYLFLIMLICVCRTICIYKYRCLLTLVSLPSSWSYKWFWALYIMLKDKLKPTTEKLIILIHETSLQPQYLTSYTVDATLLSILYCTPTSKTMLKY